MEEVKKQGVESHFCSYNQAVALKELGFDEDCLGRWLTITEWEKPTGEIKLQLGVKVEDYDKNQCLAPLKQQVFRWFRDKHGLHIGICHAVNGKFDCWTNYGNLLDEGKYCDFKTYEEAESACIDKLITIIKNK